MFKQVTSNYKTPRDQIERRCQEQTQLTFLFISREETLSIKTLNDKITFNQRMYLVTHFVQETNSMSNGHKPQKDNNN